MRKNLFSLILMTCLSLTSFAQGGGGGGGGGMGGGGGRGSGGGGGGQGGGQGQAISMNLVGATGLFEITLKDVVKKCKIKDEPTKAQAEQILVQYKNANKATAEKYKAEHYLLRTLQAKLDQGETMQSMRNDMQNAISGLRKIKQETIKTHQELANQMIMLLNQKQAAKWLKYYTKLCEKNTFSAQNIKERNQGQRGQGGGQGSGQRGGGGGF